MNLYELNTALATFVPEVDEATGELLNADALDALTMARDEKLENVALYIKNLAAESAAIKSEAKALMERASAADRKCESLKQYLAANLNGEAFETARCKVGFRKSKAVKITDEAAFWSFAASHQGYSRAKAPEPDKVAIKAALAEGKIVVGAELVENISLTVK